MRTQLQVQEASPPARDTRVTPETEETPSNAAIAAGIAQPSPEDGFLARLDPVAENHRSALALAEMSLRERLAFVETGTSQANLLALAEPDEREALVSEPVSILPLLRASMDDDQYLNSRMLLFPDEAPEAVAERISQADGFFDDVSGAMAAFGRLSVPERRDLLASQPDLTHFMNRRQTQRFEAMAESESAGLLARMVQATAGLGTEDEALPGILEDAARYHRESLHLAQELATGPSPARRADILMRLEELGDVAAILTPQRDERGRLVPGQFLHHLERDVGGDAFVAHLRTLGLPPREVAKQQVLNAMARLNDDERGVREAFAEIPQGERAALWTDPHVTQALEGLTESQRGVVEAFRDGDAVEMATQRLRDANGLFGQSEARAFEAVLELDSESRQAVAASEVFEHTRRRMNSAERAAFDEAIETGVLSLETGLAAAAGGAFDGTNEALLSVVAGQRDTETIVDLRKGYALSRGGSVPSTPAEAAALVRFLETDAILTRELGGDDHQFYLDGMLAPNEEVREHEASSPDGRLRASAILDHRADEKMGPDGRGGGGFATWFSETDETALASHWMQKAVHLSATSDGDVSAEEWARHQAHGAVFDRDFEAMVSSQNAVTDTAAMVGTTAAMLAATLASGGALGPMAANFMMRFGASAATAGTAATTVGTKEWMGGGRYDALGGDGALDAGMAAIHALTARATGTLGHPLARGLSGRLGVGTPAQPAGGMWEAMRQRAPGLVIDNTVDAGIGVVQSAVQRNAFADEFWNQGIGGMGQSLLDGLASGVQDLPLDLALNLGRDSVGTAANTLAASRPGQPRPDAGWRAMNHTLTGPQRTVVVGGRPLLLPTHPPAQGMQPPFLPGMGPRPMDPSGRGRHSVATAPPHPQHPFMQQYMEPLRNQLAAEGLPTSAEGVRIHVVDVADWHSAMVARSAAGQAGPGRGAEVLEYEVGEILSDFEGKVSLGAGPVTPDKPVWQVLDEAVLDAAETNLSRALILDRLAAQKRAEGSSQTELVNMSWGSSPRDRLSQTVETAFQNPHSPLGVTLAQVVGPVNPMRYANDPRERDRVGALLFQALQTRRAVGPMRDTAMGARMTLETSLAQSREAGLLTLIAAGNETLLVRDKGFPAEAGATDTDGLRGGVLVGSVNNRDWRNPGDDTVADFSSVGPHVMAPGVNLPVKEGSPETGGFAADDQGTSFSSPHVAGWTALMIRANPRLRPDDILSILSDSRHFDDVAAGTRRDGRGRIRPLDLVRSARAFQTDR